MGCPEEDRGQVNLRKMNKRRKLEILHRHGTVVRCSIGPACTMVHYTSCALHTGEVTK